MLLFECILSIRKLPLKGLWRSLPPLTLIMMATSLKRSLFRDAWRTRSWWSSTSSSQSTWSLTSKVSPTSRSTSPSRLNHTNYTNEGGGSQRRQDKATTCSTQQRDYAQKEKVRVYVAISIVIIIIITITIISIIIIIFVIIITIGNIFAPYVVPTLIFPSICICLLCYQRRTQLFSKHFKNSTIAWTQKLPNPWYHHHHDVLQSRESGGCQHYQLHRHDQAKEKSTKRKGKEKIQEKSRVTGEKFKVGLTLEAKEHKSPK